MNCYKENTTKHIKKGTLYQMRDTTNCKQNFICLRLRVKGRPEAECNHFHTRAAELMYCANHNYRVRPFSSIALLNATARESDIEQRKTAVNFQARFLMTLKNTKTSKYLIIRCSRIIISNTLSGTTLFFEQPAIILLSHTVETRILSGTNKRKNVEDTVRTLTE